eukprot:TRINITY_DN218_c0_g1_i1.p1 TRINITY_DN218_c0_g1~~TRINITY_DN218_c0_g1_i1.p1  ORF type:complete len:105 (+),score=26.26 TRINITY_DN218_c0_g1_i1:110-424(+)
MSKNKKGAPVEDSVISKNNKLDQVQTEIKNTQGVLLKNIELTLARGDQISALEDKSIKMNNHAKSFKKKAAETKRHFCMQHYRNILILLVILAVIGVVLYLVFK